MGNPLDKEQPKPISDHKLPEHYYRALFERSADGIMFLENGVFVDCNQAAAEMLGYKHPAELVELHPSEISPEFQPNNEASFEMANAIMENAVNNSNQRFDWVHLRSDGSPIDIEVLLTAIPHNNGYSLQAVLRDITERKRLEKNLQHSQKMDVIGKLAGGIAHDFNNQLVPILGYADMLASALEDQPQLQNWAKEIHHASNSAATLVNKLLAFSRNDISQPQNLELITTIESVLDILRRLIGEDIETTFECSQEQVWIRADAGDIEQILLNVATNSRDAMPMGGHFAIVLSVIERDGQKLAKLEMSDSGKGMDKAVLSQVFTPFFTTKEQGYGTGLGLATVHELVSRIRGEIAVHSTVGVGTTIEVLFPTLSTPVGQVADDSAIQRSEKVSGTQPAHILIVEDDANITRFILDVLSEAGYTTSTASDGNEALLLIPTIEPDLVLTDVIMSSMSGPQMAQKLKALGVDTPVLFMSGYTDDILATHGFDTQAIYLIRKPFTPDVLLKQIKLLMAA